ncbi:pyocin knob domain-containing protein [Indiicoccus explosivorum]|uniref:pyocin knob domain-containing protein n=1 Tax=Indiicoccus explosivorum TaxID=1917864 RepID=UPI000B4484FE|nr:pyocin knob domain-containing protein [Indiicoccus explosivorum]
MPFQQPLIGWGAVGIEPPQSLKDAGWQAQQKPPAEYFNWTFRLLDQALLELQQNAVHSEQVGVANGIARLNADGKPINADGSLAGEVTQIEFDEHTDDTTVHITATERTDWNAKETPAGAQAKVNSAVNALVNGAPVGLDTLVELAAAVANDPDFATSVSNALDAKVDKVTGKQLSTEDYTSAEKTKLGGIESGANKYVHPATHAPSIIAQDVNNRFVSDTEKNNWNAKETPAGAQEKANQAEADAINWAKELGLGAIAKSVADANDARAGGFYYVTNAGLNAPNGETAAIIVIQGSNYGQLALAASGRMFSRIYTSAGWSAWAERETTSGAQAKADAAASKGTNDAKTWTRSFGFGDNSKGQVPANADLNTIVASGFYRLQSGHANQPSAAANFGQMLVLHGQSDTITQLVSEHSTGKLYTRSGNPPQVGGSGTWGAWTELETTAGAQAKVNAHAENTIQHINSDERTAWNEKVTGVGTGKITVSATAPTAPGEGDIWIEV